MSSQAKTDNPDPEKEFLQMVTQFNATSLEAILTDTEERLEIGAEMLIFCDQYVVDLMTIQKEHQKCTSKLANEITPIQNHHLNELASKVLSNGFDENWHAQQIALLKRQLEEMNTESDKYENEYFSMIEESTNLENKAKGIQGKIVQEKKRIREERASKRAAEEMKRIEEEAERKRLEEKDAERTRNEEEEAQQKHMEQETKCKEEAERNHQKEEESERNRKEKEAEQERQEESRKRRRSDSVKEKRAEKDLKTSKKEPSNPSSTFPKTPYKKMAVADLPIRPPSSSSGVGTPERQSPIWRQPPLPDRNVVKATPSPMMPPSVRFANTMATPKTGHQNAAAVAVKKPVPMVLNKTMETDQDDDSFWSDDD